MNPREPEVAAALADPEVARTYLETLRWPDGLAVCPGCSVKGRSRRLAHQPGSQSRPGLWKCGACRKQFTVTVNTLCQGSHVALNKWLMAVRLFCQSRHDPTAREIQDVLGVTYKSAWFMKDRFRYAMTEWNWRPKQIEAAMAQLLSIQPAHRQENALEKRIALNERRRELRAPVVIS